jgi:hypothetical protein
MNNEIADLVLASAPRPEMIDQKRPESCAAELSKTRLFKVFDFWCPRQNFDLSGSASAYR